MFKLWWIRETGCIEHITDFLRATRQGLHNFWTFRTVLWLDRDYDWTYLYQLMEFKMRRMALMQQHHGHSEDSGTLAQQLTEAADLLQRIYEDQYIDGDQDYRKGLAKQQADLEDFAARFVAQSLLTGRPWLYRRSSFS